jgi:hypothetical protein
MFNPPDSSTKSSISVEGVIARLVGEDKVPHGGGQEEVPHEDGQDEVPYEDGKDEVPHEGGDHKVPQQGGDYEVPGRGGVEEAPHVQGLQQEGSFDKSVSGDPFSENHLLVEEETEAGPSGMQHPVVVCGGDDPPELCEYEKLRERNIRERDEAMKEAMEGIEDAKQDMRDNAPGAKKRTAEKEAKGRRKRKKVEPVVEVRRSGRERKPVSYLL